LRSEPYIQLMGKFEAIVSMVHLPFMNSSL